MCCGGFLCAVVASCVLWWLLVCQLLFIRDFSFGVKVSHMEGASFEEVIPQVLAWLHMTEWLRLLLIVGNGISFCWRLPLWWWLLN